MADNVDHTHGDSGTKPAQDLNFQDGDYPDPEVFDWFWSEVPAAINDHASLLEDIDSNEDGVVDRADELSSSSVGNGLKGGDANSVEVEPAEIAGDGVEDDGTDNLRVVDEYIEDLVNALLNASDKLSWTYDDANDILTLSTTALDNEEVEDAVSSLLSTGSNLSVSYDDANDTLTISLSDSISVSSLEVTDSITDANGTTHTDELADASDLASETESKGVASGYNRQTQSVTATIPQDSGGGSGQTSVTYTNTVDEIAADMNASFQGSNEDIESINIDVELLAEDGSVKSTVNLYNNNAFNNDVDPIFNGISVSRNFTEINFTDYNILLSVGRAGTNINEDENMTVSFDPLSFHVVTLPTHKHQLNQ